MGGQSYLSWTFSYKKNLLLDGHQPGKIVLTVSGPQWNPCLIFQSKMLYFCGCHSGLDSKVSWFFIAHTFSIWSCDWLPLESSCDILPAVKICIYFCNLITWSLLLLGSLGIQSTNYVWCCLLLFWCRGPTYMDGKMTYPEFVWFLLSEEDKKHPRRLLLK